MNFKLGKINKREVITCLLLIIAGYMSARLFTRMNAGFRVGGQSVPDYCKSPKCLYGTYPYSDKQDICNKVSESNCEKTWYKNTAKRGTEEIGIGCYWNKAGKQCVTPGTGFKSASGCLQKECSYKPPAPPGKTPKPPAPTPPGKTPTPPGVSKTTWDCTNSKCQEVTGTSGKYDNISDCRAECTATNYSCNASTSKCAPDSSGSYTNASDCQKACDSTDWSFWIAVIIWVVSIAPIIGGFIALSEGEGSSIIAFVIGAILIGGGFVSYKWKSIEGSI